MKSLFKIENVHKVLFLAKDIFSVTIETVIKVFFTADKPACQKVHVCFLRVGFWF